MLNGQIVLVTGASRGIGNAIALTLGGAGATVIGTATSEEGADNISKIFSESDILGKGMKLNVTDNDQITSVLKAVTDEYGAVDILINNAGYAKHGAFHKTPLDTHTDMMHLLTTTLTELTYLYSEDMKRLGGGYILLVASIAGFMPIPQFATYAASKAFVLSLGEALNKELSEFNIKVTTLCPGGTATEFMDVSGQNITGFRRHAIMTSDAVARAGLRAVAKGKAVIVPGLLYKFSMAGLRAVPRGLQAMIGEAATK